MHHLVGAAEIADMLGVSRQRVHQIRCERGFPEPVMRLSMGWIWERAAVEEWMVATGRASDMDERP